MTTFYNLWCEDGIPTTILRHLRGDGGYQGTDQDWLRSKTPTSEYERWLLKLTKALYQPVINYPKLLRDPECALFKTGWTC